MLQKEVAVFEFGEVACLFCDRRVANREFVAELSTTPLRSHDGFMSQREAWVSPLTAWVVIAILDREGG